MIHFVPGNRLTLLVSGDDYFPALLREMAAARSEIYLETYIYQHDATGIAVTEALVAAARRGVAVHVLVDGFGAHDFHAGLRQQLEEAGVHFLVYRPQISPWTFKRQRLRRLHRKLVVVDGQTGFVGGINIIDDLDTPGHTPPRFDYAVQVSGPLVAIMRASARHVWSVVAWTHGQHKLIRDRVDLPAPAHLPGVTAAFAVRDNIGHRRDIENAYLEAIREAKDEILIANAYFLPGRQFRHALVQAAQRGVKVRLLLQGRVEYWMLHYASRALYRNFLKNGVEIIEYHRSFLHAKVAVIDGGWATVGSSNIDPFSLMLAREANVVVRDEDFAAALKRSLERAIEIGAHSISAERWQGLSWRMRLLTWLALVGVRAFSALAGFSFETGRRNGEK